jgi:hypothetical protein
VLAYVLNSGLVEEENEKRKGESRKSTRKVVKEMKGNDKNTAIPMA